MGAYNGEGGEESKGEDNVVVEEAVEEVERERRCAVEVGAVGREDVVQNNVKGCDGEAIVEERVDGDEGNL